MLAIVKSSGPKLFVRCAAVVLALGAGRAAADAPVNVTTNGEQRRVAVAFSPASSNAFFVWEDAPATNVDLRGRIYFSGTGLFSTQQVVNVLTNGQQLFPSVAGTSNGFLVAWQTHGFYTNNYAIAARRFLSNGVPVEAQEFRVNVDTNFSATRPVAGVLTNGGFFVAYERSNGSDQNLYMRRYAADGSTADLSDAPLIGSGADEGAPALARLKGGSFVLAYENRDTDTVPVAVLNSTMTAGFFASSNLLTNAWVFSSPAVAALTDGGFVMVCDAETNNTAAGRMVVAQLYTSNGVARAAMVLGSHTQRWERPRVAGMPNGGFVVTWQTPGSPGDSTNAFAVYSARFTSNGVPASWPHAVPAVNSNDQESAVVVSLSDGSHIIGWQSFGQDTTNSHGVFVTGASGPPTTGPVLAIGATGSTGTVRVAGASYELYTIETSTNLQQWVFLTQTNSPTGISTWLDLARTNKLRHFRAWGYP